MPHFTIEGADRTTGEDRVLSIDARDETIARAEAQRAGLVVSDVHASKVSHGRATRANDEEDDEALARLAAAAHASVLKTEVGGTVGYRGQSAVEAATAPQYGLLIGGWMLRVLGVGYAALGTVVAYVRAELALSAASLGRGPLSGSFSFLAANAMSMCVPLMIGAATVVLGEAALALRNFLRAGRR